MDIIVAWIIYIRGERPRHVASIIVDAVIAIVFASILTFLLYFVPLTMQGQREWGLLHLL